jgi:hypothetical protein
MRRTWLVSTFIAILILFLVAGAMAVPKMFLPEEKFDFGYVPQDSKVSHVFWIKSVGEDTLKILNVKPG